MLDFYGDNTLGLCGSLEQLHELGRAFQGSSKPHRFPLNCLEISTRKITTLELVPTGDDTDKLTVDIPQPETMRISGNAHAFERVGENLLTFFDSDSAPHDHFHLDSFTGDLNDTPYGLVFELR